MCCGVHRRRASTNPTPPSFSLVRRKLKQTVAKVEVTKDEEYNLLHGKYVDVEHRMSRINT